MCVSNKQTYETVWEIEEVNPNVRFEKYAEKVPANMPILIKHSHTCHFLASDAVPYKNDYGGEFEVTVHSYSKNNKSQNLALEFKGQITSDVPSKFQLDQNIWKIVTAPDPSFDSADGGDDHAFKVEMLLKEVKARLLERSSYGIRGLSRIFKIMDDNGNGQLDVDDFRWGLIDFGISISKEEAEMLLSAFDRDGNGMVSFDEFL